MRETLTEIQESALKLVMERRRSNPITGLELAAQIGLQPHPGGRQGADLRSVIHALRCKAFPVCASGSGYYWPANDIELNEYIGSLQARMEDVAKAVAGMRMSRDKISTEVAKKGIEASKLYYYEVGTHPNVICKEVRGDRVEEFLAKYPDARKV